MTMSLKTHTAYPEIQVTEAFDADGQTVYPWEAKIVQQPAETFEEFKAKWGDDFDIAFPNDVDMTVLTATTAVSFTGTAITRQAAIDEAVALIASVQDEYLKEVV